MIDLRENEQAGWLSLAQASEKMGVSAATLRAWADDGRVESYRTPGGHRRFRLGDKTVPFRAQTGQGDSRWRLLEHAALGRVQMAREDVEGLNLNLPPQARKELRELERALVQFVTLGLHKPAAENETRAVELGQAHGKWNWRFGVGTHQAQIALGNFRRAYTASVVEFAFGVGEPNPEELVLWLDRANEIIDRVNVSMLEYRTEEPVPHGGKK